MKHKHCHLTCWKAGAAALALIFLAATFACKSGGGAAGVALTVDYNDPVAGPGDVTMEAALLNGNNAYFDIIINNVANVYGAKFHLSYNPDVFNFLSASKTGSVLAGGACSEACLILSAVDDSDAGKVIVSIARNPVGAGGVTADGSIVRLYLVAVGAGNAGFAFSNQELKDPAGVVIAATWKTDATASTS